MAFRKFGSLIERIASTVTSGGTLTLVNNSQTYQRFTGTSTHTVVLPDATTCPIGMKFVILNRSTGAVTVNYNGGSLAMSVDAGSQRTFRVVSNGTSAGTWDITNEAGVVATLSTSQAVSAVLALSNQQFNDGSVVSKKVSVNPEEIGADVWTSACSLPTALYSPMSLALNGFIYHVGGSTSGGVQTTNYRHDDAQNYWVAKGAHNQATYFGSGFALGGFGWVAGGILSGSGYTATSDKYNDASDSWTAGPALPAANKRQAGMTVIGDYAFFTSGFSGSVNNTNYGLNTTLNTWITKATAPSSKYAGGSFVVNGIGFWAAGNNGSVQDSSVYGYNPVIDSWNTFTSVTNNRDQMGCSDNTGPFTNYLMGGNTGGSTVSTVDEYVGSSNFWRSRSSMANVRQEQGNAVLNGQYFQIGGGGNNADTAPLSTVERYRNFSWQTLGVFSVSKTAPSKIYAAVALNNMGIAAPVQLRTNGEHWKNLTANTDSALKLNETITTKYQPKGAGVVIGGDNNSVAFNINQQYNDIANSWGTYATAPGGIVNNVAGFRIGALGYMAGGNNGSTTNYANVYSYSNLLNSYSAVASLPSAKRAAPGDALNGFGYTIAGYDSAVINTNYQFNPTANTWAVKTAVNVSRTYPLVLTTSGFLYVAGGSTTTSAAAYTTDAEIYNDATNAWTTKTATPWTDASPNALSLNGVSYRAGGASSAGGWDPSVYSYNNSTDTWSSKSLSLLTNVMEASCFAQNGYGYVCAGWAAPVSAATQQYNDASNSFASKANMSQAIEGGTSNMLSGSYYNYEMRVGIPAAILQGGGGSAWVTKTSMPVGQISGTSFDLNGNMYHAAGLDATARMNRVYRFDPNSNTWTQDAAYPISVSANGGPSSGSMVGGFGYGVGGDNGSGFSNCYNFNADTHIWTAITSAPVAIDAGIVVGLNSNIFQTSAHPSYGGSQGARKYTVATAAWSTLTSTNSTHYSGSGGVLNGFNYITSDSANNGVHEQYNENSNAWTTKTAMPSPLEEPGILITSEGYLCSGGYNSGYQAVSQLYQDSMNAWLIKTSYPVASYGQLGSTINGTGYLASGYTGSYTGATYAYVSSVKNAILGVGLKVS